MLIELQVGKPISQVGDRHVNEFHDVFPAYLHITGFMTQTTALAFRTGGLTAVVSEHHPVLNLILVLTQHLKECINADAVGQVFTGTSVPKQGFLFLGKTVVRREYREVVSLSPADEFFLPFTHFLSTPANHSSVHHAQFGIGNDQMLVYAESLTLGTCSHWGIEGEKVFRRFLKSHAVGFKKGGVVFYF